MTGSTTSRPRRATIEDVAQRAGVSVATVSRALRGLPNVAASTRTRVSTAATELNYAPHPAATRLAAGRTSTITIAVATLNGWYCSTVVAGAEAVCTEAGYDFLVVGIGTLDDQDHLLREETHLERRTDGLILVDLRVTEQEAASLQARGVAVATVGSSLPGHPSVTIDNVLVGRLATEHLLGLGHRRIGLIGGHPHTPLSPDVPLGRRTGYVQALEDAGLAADDDLFRVGDFGIDGGIEAMATLLDLDDPPTAVFAMSDEMAFGALMAIRARGRSVPGDISLVGVDDHEFARVVGLTTIRQTVASHGADAARLLIDSMAAPADTPRHDPVVCSPVTLVERDTTEHRC